MEPLTIAVLKALTPPDVETELFDDRIELIDYNTKTDLVIITVETYTALRSYNIAQKFLDRNIPVIMGGYHVTLVPNEAINYCTSVIIGNAENVWSQVIKDAKCGYLKKVYNGGCSCNMCTPDKSIFQGKSYLPVSLIETGRGCYNKCEFCAIQSYYNQKYYFRNHDDIIKDVENSKHKYHFLVDDNLIANKKNALELFNRLEPYRIKWAGQGTLSMAYDKELLKAMKRSGCELILIGFESLEEKNLRAMNKSVNILRKERDELVKRIHDAGIGIYATFVFGYDEDTEGTFHNTVDFAKKHNFYTAAFNHLLPFPGTRLYERLKNENRLIYDKWWMEKSYSYGKLAFHPKNMSAEKLSDMCRQARKEFASFPTVIKRGIMSMKRSDILMWSLFWAMNLRLGFEIDEKINVPLGGNLDELPK